jgi:hypothetical protein
LQVASDDPETLANAALALAYFGEDISAMMALVDRALALNPSFARGWHISGTLRLWAGQPDLAIEHIEASLRLSPRARVGMAFSLLGAAHLSEPTAGTQPCRREPLFMPHFGPSSIKELIRTAAIRQAVAQLQKPVRFIGHQPEREIEIIRRR